MGRSDFLFAEPSFWEGMSRIFDFGDTLNIYNESPNAQIADGLAIWMDWCITGDDLAEALNNYKEKLNLEVA